MDYSIFGSDLLIGLAILITVLALWISSKSDSKTQIELNRMEDNLKEKNCEKSNCNKKRKETAEINAESL